MTALDLYLQERVLANQMPLLSKDKPSAFDQQVLADLQILLKQKEPPECDMLFGIDEISNVYPPHKAVRVVTWMLLRISLLRVYMYLLVCGIAVVEILLLPLGVAWRIAGAVAALFFFHLWFGRKIERHLIPIAEYIYLYWHANRSRRDFSSWELSRINHIFMSRVSAFFTGSVCLILISAAFCIVLFFRWWLWGIVGFLIVSLAWNFAPQISAYINNAVFKTAPERIGEMADKLAHEAAAAGRLPGDRSPRSLKCRNISTGRILRLPATNGSFALAHISPVSYTFALLFVFSPIIYLVTGSRLAYLPIGQVGILIAIWLLHKLVKIYKAKDNRRFQTVLLRPFRQTQSAFAKNAIVPVLGSIGTGITVEDFDFQTAKVPGSPWSVQRDVSSGLDAVFPYITGRDWKPEVANLISQSDAAVIDVTNVTDELEWELSQCFEHLPPCRIIFVAQESEKSNRELLKGVDQLLLFTKMNEPLSHMIRYRRSPFGQIVFKANLLKAFRVIRENG